MITKKIGIIGCGNMGGAILYGALESGVLPVSYTHLIDDSPFLGEPVGLHRSGAKIKAPLSAAYHDAL